jgi:hypothetical protein
MYKLLKNLDGTPSTTGVLRISDGAFIPVHTGNADYQKYQLWLQAGNTPQPAE